MEGRYGGIFPEDLSGQGFFKSGFTVAVFISHGTMPVVGQYHFHREGWWEWDRVHKIW